VKTAILVLVMAPMVAMASRVATADLADSSLPKQKPSAAHEEGITTNPTVAPAPAPAAAPAASPTGSNPTATTTASSGAPAEKDKQGLSVEVDLDHWLGTGTFYNPQYYSYLAANLSVVLRYAFKVKDVKLAASLSGRLTYEYTLPDNSNGRRFAPWDTRLGISAPGLIKNDFTGIKVSPSLGLVIPTTLESWQAGLITSISAGLSASKSVYKFDFMLTASGARAFHKNPMNLVNAQQDPCHSPALTAPEAGQKTLAQCNGTAASTAGQLSVLSRAGEPFSDSAGMNTAWTASVGGNIKFRATEELSFSLGYTYLHYWKYELPIDQYTPAALDSNGNPVATASGQADRTFGVISADYSLNDHYGVSLSASTIQTPKSGAAGGAGYYRFPFWAVNNGPSNATSINFTFSAAY
jgi:hypothetical protein